MNVIERLKYLDTPEGEAIFAKAAKNFMEEEKNRERRIKEIITGGEYIVWLEKFTIKHTRFSDNDWLYCPEEISGDDRARVEELNLFYRGIDAYASKNFISPSFCDFGNYYCIKFGNIGYEIGIIVGQGTLFFCNRVSMENKEFIDFADIQNDKEQPKTKLINKKLNILKEELSLLINNFAEDVPLATLEETTRNIIKETLETIYIERKKYY